MNCKYCGFKLTHTGCLSTDGKQYHKGCLEIMTIRKNGGKE